MKLSFTKPLNQYNFFVISCEEKEVIGYIKSNDNFLITDIYISPLYFQKVKNKVIPKFLFHIGKDNMEVELEDKFKEWYEELGFRYKNKLEDDKVLMIYG